MATIQTYDQITAPARQRNTPGANRPVSDPIDPAHPAVVSVQTQAALSVVSAADTNHDGQMTQAELNRYLIQQGKLLRSAKMTQEGYQAALQDLQTAAFLKRYYTPLAAQDTGSAGGNPQSISAQDITVSAASDGISEFLSADELPVAVSGPVFPTK